MARKKLRQFFLNGHLHRMEWRDRSKDLCRAFDHVDKEYRVYRLSEVEKFHGKAYSLWEAAKFLGRHPQRLLRWIKDEGAIEPQREIDRTGKPFRYFLSEEDVMDLYDFMCTVHRGRPRKDGRVTNDKLPSREELLMMLRTNQVLYREDEDGNMVPVWKERY